MRLYSPICHLYDWPTDIDEMAALYDTELIGLYLID